MRGLRKTARVLAQTLRNLFANPERKARADRTAKGIPLDEQSFGDILRAAERYGLTEKTSLAYLLA